MVVFALEVSFWDGTRNPITPTPWFWLSGAWLLAAIPIGYALRAFATRRA